LSAYLVTHLPPPIQVSLTAKRGKVISASFLCPFIVVLSMFDMPDNCIKDRNTGHLDKGLFKTQRNADLFLSTFHYQKCESCVHQLNIFA
jgi:hypothetical protein